MTGEQWKVLAEKIRSADPDTRRTGLLALKGALQLMIAMIDNYIEKEDNHA